MRGSSTMSIPTPSTLIARGCQAASYGWRADTPAAAFAPPGIDIVRAPDEVYQPEAAHRTAKGGGQADRAQQCERNLQRAAIPEESPRREEQEDAGLDAIDDEQKTEDGVEAHAGTILVEPPRACGEDGKRGPA